jgi:proteasome lid subunit RPN8/RPN11
MGHGAGGSWSQVDEVSTTTRPEQSRAEQSRVEKRREEQSNQPALQHLLIIHSMPPVPSRLSAADLRTARVSLLFASGRRKLLLSSPSPLLPFLFLLSSFLFLSPPPLGGRWVNCGLEHGTPTLGIGDFDGGTSRTRTSTSWRSKNKRETNRGFRQPFVNGGYCHRL